MRKSFDKVYWITHPAYSAIYYDREAGKYSAKDAWEFIEKKILPDIAKAATEKRSLVVLVRSPGLRAVLETGLKKGLLSDSEWAGRLMRRLREMKAMPKKEMRKVKSGILKETGGSSAMERKMRGVEKRLERELVKIAGERLISTGMLDKGRAAGDVVRQMRERGFALDRNARIIGYGSYRKECATVYPKKFREQMNVEGNFSVSKKGTMHIERKTGRRLP